ncbi:MAG: TIGR03118 family protein [Armatimonadetes bacterium]|nr:TIGR03118 family protein [Armatimonadota bacterium]
MTRLEWKRSLAAVAFVFVAAGQSFADGFLETDLVSNRSGFAQITDVDLVNPWGIAYSPTSPFWVANNGTGTATLYNVAPSNDLTSKNALVVTIPGAGNVTGQAFNGGSGFNSDRFMFVNEDGTVSGWRGALGTQAEILKTGSPDNVYKGAATATIGGHDYLYMANFRSGNVDVMKGDNGAADLTGRFTDPNLPGGYAPFNIQRLGNTMYVTYGQQDAQAFDVVTGAGLGFVNAFDLQGNLLGRVGTRGSLDAPWGLAIAPTTFGAFAGDLLVGNFGDGRVSAFDAVTHAFKGQLQTPGGSALSIDGLWALTPGNGGNGGSADRIYFSAGPNGEADGLFGSIAMVPEPTAGFACLIGIGALMKKRRSQRP